MTKNELLYYQYLLRDKDFLESKYNKEGVEEVKKYFDTNSEPVTILIEI